MSFSQRKKDEDNYIYEDVKAAILALNRSIEAFKNIEVNEKKYSDGRPAIINFRNGIIEVAEEFSNQTNSLVKMLQDIKSLTKQDATTFFQSIKSANEMMTALKETIENHTPENVEKVQKEARALVGGIAILDAKLGKKEWKAWAGNALMLTGLALIFIGQAFIPALGTGLAVAGIGAGLMGLGSYLVTDHTPVEKKIAKLKELSMQLDRQAQRIFNPDNQAKNPSRSNATMFADKQNKEDVEVGMEETPSPKPTD